MNSRSGLCLVFSFLFSTATAHAEEIVVSAASSLTNAMKEIAQHYESQHPGLRVLLNFGGSGALLQQIARGAPVDVFAPADDDSMDAAEAQGLVPRGKRRDFAGNVLVVAVPKDGGTGLTTLQDLNSSTVRRIAIGNPASVSAGRHARGALQAARLWGGLQDRLIHTQNVRQALDYAARGEVDAAIVFATDVREDRERVRVAFEVRTAEPIRYPVACTVDGDKKERVRAFVAFLLSPQGQSALKAHGFLPPG
ncbi:MAG: molybdate ABC transporter substrate-binding protein [Acidobacteria bacterium]|nr:molybdate ABC transporter substrate-binding protein [Acidobacteriota bacterium]MCK6681618.1 molybdate ABC transporter substrate-binding protein [Thermoanaerobaculia bacterium]